MHRIRGDGRRAVAEYCFEGRGRVVAKLYRDNTEGRAAYDVLCSLWTLGLGPRSAFRVPEPIAYLAEHGVLLMGAASGRPLPTIQGGHCEAFEESLRRAADWLAVLHSSPLRLGPRQDAAHDVSRLARRAATASMCRPDLDDVVRRVMEELAGRASTAESKAAVQTHGRYHADHVFLAPGSVTVIDTDRAAVADPMKDVGEFLHRLRWQAARAGWVGDAVERSTDAFLMEYAPQIPVELSPLTYYWSYSIVWTLLALACKARPGEGRREERSRFLQKEFALVPQRAAAFRISGPG